MKYVLVWFIFFSVLVKPAMPMLEYFVDNTTSIEYSGKSWLVQQLLKQSAKEKKEATANRIVNIETSSYGILQSFSFSIIRLNSITLKYFSAHHQISVFNLIISVFQPPKVN